jgi:hypothetical protein
MESKENVVKLVLAGSTNDDGGRRFRICPAILQTFRTSGWRFRL